MSRDLRRRVVVAGVLRDRIGRYTVLTTRKSEQFKIEYELEMIRRINSAFRAETIYRCDRSENVLPWYKLWFGEESVWIWLELSQIK